MSIETLTINNQNSKVTFSAQKLFFIKVNGTIKDFNGQINFNKDNLDQSSFDVCITAATISTENEKRDDHLKAADFFDIENHPSICFKSNSIQEVDGQYRAIGELTIVGSTNQIEIPFEFNGDTFSGQLTINRQEFKLGTKFPSFFIANKIDISISCSVK